MPENLHAQTSALGRGQTAADQVFEILHKQILTNDLSPGEKISETETAKKMGLSRQPVREAFFRLSQQGFLLIRPQRATVVLPISEIDVLQAMYVRTALEVEVVCAAAEKKLGDEQLKQLSNILEAQRSAYAARDQIQLFELDDKFHRTISELTGADFVWKLISEQKAQMDRVRYLSISEVDEPLLEEHQAIFEAIKKGDSAAAVQQMRKHLSHFESNIRQLRSKHPQFFSAVGT